jgi:hypothetical protein
VVLWREWLGAVCSLKGRRPGVWAVKPFEPRHAPVVAALYPPLRGALAPFPARPGGAGQEKGLNHGFPRAARRNQKGFEQKETKMKRRFGKSCRKCAVFSNGFLGCGLPQSHPWLKHYGKLR